MKKLFFVFIACLTLSTLLNSCSIEKRLHQDGYHISWSHRLFSNKNEGSYEIAKKKIVDHDIYSTESENGNPLNCYLCVNEMDSAWVKRSIFQLDRSNKEGFLNRTVLIRYLTSKDLPKDAEGVNALNEQDIKNLSVTFFKLDKKSKNEVSFVLLFIGYTSL
jgi:hypothetical protein